MLQPEVTGPLCMNLILNADFSENFLQICIVDWLQSAVSLYYSIKLKIRSYDILRKFERIDIMYYLMISVSHIK